MTDLQASLKAQLALVARDVKIMRGYQTDELVPFGLANPYSGLFVDMGLGKTVSVATILNHEFERGAIEKCLIIAPLRVATQTWPTELSQWSHTWWMSRTLIRADERHPELLAAQAAARASEREDVMGSPQWAARKAKTAHLELQRRRLAREPTMIHIINREAVEWLVDFHGKHWPYDCVIVDESTSFADHTTKRWKALNKVRSRFKRLHLLSGIPGPEGVEDYFAQIYLLDRGERFGRGITAFRERYMTQSRYTRRWKPREGADEAVAEKMADICIVMPANKYLDMGEPTVIERPITLDPHQLRMYKNFSRDLILKLPNDVEIEAENASALWQKLMQFASGAVYDADRKVHEVHDHKLEELMQLREEAQGSPMMIAYWHKSSLARLRRLLPKATVMDKEGACVSDWNKGKISDLLIHPASAGHGLNMQLGPGHILTFFDQPLPLELYEQLIGRLHRSGQKNPVLVYHLATVGTIDADIVPLLRQKKSAEIAVRRYIQKIREENDL